MNKAELLQALEWIADDAPLHVAFHHEALDGVMEVRDISEVIYRFPVAGTPSGRVEITCLASTPDGGRNDAP
jgi:hypothetical protein